MGSTPPDVIKWGLLIGVPLLLLVFAILGPVRLFLDAKVPQIRALLRKENYVKTELGMSLFWDQTLKLRGADFDRVAKILVREMAKPGLLHAQKCMEQITKLTVEVRNAPLRSPLRTAAGVGDLNKDGQEDTYTGLTHSASYIEIAAFDVPKRAMLDKDGFVVVERTAFSYELLNALIWLGEGYEIAIAEGRLPGFQEAVGNTTNEAAFARRKQFDDAFAAIDWTQT